MNSPVFNALSTNSAPVNPSLMQRLQQFNEFKRTFNGNPQQIVQDLLKSGKMTQAQYDAIVPQATQLYNLINR